jgi:hypothetical protein
MPCDISKGSASGLNPILITLQPNVPAVWTWDFSDCNTPIWNFVAAVTKPRNQQGAQRSLPPNTPLQLTGKNVTSGQDYPDGNFIVDFTQPGSVGGQVIQLNLLYTGHNPLDIEISYSAVL